MRENIIKSLESTRGYIDGLIADIAGSDSDSAVDALDFITAARRLRVKGLDVLQQAVEHAAWTDASWEDMASRYGLTAQEVKDRYPEAVDIRRRRDESRRAFEDGAF